MPTLTQLRQEYHKRICQQLLGHRQGSEIINIADRASLASVGISRILAAKMGCDLCASPPAGGATGAPFAQLTRDFLERAFAQELGHLRPGPWQLSTRQAAIAMFEQYQHLEVLQKAIEDKPELKSALGGDYLITPDIVVFREPLPDVAINSESEYVVAADMVAKRSPIRKGNVEGSPPILHASISCKWTMRSDRSQNTRTEALNLIRNRKGGAPRIVVVTMEPLPGRLASIAMGTGDVDCTYHAALNELTEAVNEIGDEGHKEMLEQLIVGRRLRDISDLPLDLAI